MSYRPPVSGAVHLVFTAQGIVHSPGSVIIAPGTAVMGYYTTTYQQQNVTTTICDHDNDKYSFGFNGQEKVNEWAGLGNHNTALDWEYGTREGKRLNRDTWNPNPSISPYIVFDDNPIWKNDPLGNVPDNYVFNENGNFERIDKNNKPDRLVIENSKTGQSQSYVFNDPVHDVQAIKNKGITRVEVMTNQKLETLINSSGVKNVRGNHILFAYHQGAGKMDYGINGIRSGMLNKNAFYIRENKAYNVGDIGNYTWGAGMAALGIDLSVAKFGAQLNNMVNGRNQKTSDYNFGKGTYGSPSLFDSPEDQQAIEDGYKHSPEGISKMKQDLQQSAKQYKSLQNEVKNGPKF